MGESSGIAWCDATFNPWWGCTEVSPACDLCYARTFDKRMGRADWGKDAPRRFFGHGHWNAPLTWNEKARKAGKRIKVFCGSMCDILDTWQGTPTFEKDEDQAMWEKLMPRYKLRNHAYLDAARDVLWEMIEKTVHIDWLLLTKRPQNYRDMLPPWWLKTPLPNVWIMTTIEAPEYFWRSEHIARIPAVVHGISWEPGLAYVDFRPFRRLEGLWVIAGGESGVGCRLFDLNAMNRIRIDCAEIGASFFLKQLGGHPDKRDKPDQWPEEIRIQQFPR